MNYFDKDFRDNYTWCDMDCRFVEPHQTVFDGLVVISLSLVLCLVKYLKYCKVRLLYLDNQTGSDMTGQPRESFHHQIICGGLVVISLSLRINL